MARNAGEELLVIEMLVGIAGRGYLMKRGCWKPVASGGGYQ